VPQEPAVSQQAAAHQEPAALLRLAERREPAALWRPADGLAAVERAEQSTAGALSAAGAVWQLAAVWRPAEQSELADSLQAVA
jgi:hypothetical protein